MLVSGVDDNLYCVQVAFVSSGVRRTNGSRNTQTNVPCKSKLDQLPVQVQSHKQHIADKR